MGIIRKVKGLSATSELRCRAEEQLNPLAADETQRLLHELQVHQIELEMQNAELSNARNEMEAALEKYTDLYDFAPVGYYTLDSSGTIDEVNLAGASLLNIERSSLLGQRFGKLVTDNYRSAFESFLATVFSSQVKEVCEVELLNEGKRPFFVQIEAVANASGRWCRLAVIDISIRWQLEEQLEILHTDLAARAADLTTANIELEAFNYTVSHDLRIPLTVINSYSQLLQEMSGSRLDEECRGYVAAIYEGTLRMNRLIDSLLDFSTVERTSISHGKVDLSNMVKELTICLKLVEPERNVTFRIAEGVTAEGDADLLQVLLNNIIANAWKYSSRQEAAVIEFGVTESAGNDAYFIRDNGRGFDMTSAGELFIPFHRLAGADIEGRGIGLATVERIVRRHGGKVWAESEPGKGATFFFTINESPVAVKMPGMDGR